MKKLLVLAALLGITFYYNVDLEFGWAWINSSLEHYTVVEQSSVNTVTIYRSDGWHLKMTLEEYIQMEGKKTLKAIKEAEIIIHKRPAGMEQPKITY